MLCTISGPHLCAAHRQRDLNQWAVELTRPNPQGFTSQNEIVHFAYFILLFPGLILLVLPSILPQWPFTSWLFHPCSFSTETSESGCLWMVPLVCLGRRRGVSDWTPPSLWMRCVWFCEIQQDQMVDGWTDQTAGHTGVSVRDRQQVFAAAALNHSCEFFCLSIFYLGTHECFPRIPALMQRWF